MKKIIISFAFLFICLFGFNYKVSAISFYYSMDLTPYTDLRSSSRSALESNFMNIDVWRTFYNDMVSRININNNTVFADFNDITIITNMRYESYYNLYHFSQLVFCPTDSISIVGATVPYLYCNSDSVIMINTGADYLAASVQGGTPRNAGGLNQYAFVAGQAVLGIYTNDSSINSNGDYVAYLYSKSIPMYLIPTNIIYNPNLEISNWTKHCLSGQNTFFSVIPNSVDTNNHDVVDDFIIFPYTIKDYGINWLQYDTITTTNLYEINYDIEFLYQYILNPYEEMQELADTYYMQLFDSKYSGLYDSLYGYNIFLNRYQYTVDSKYNIQVFRFNNTYTERPFCSVVGSNDYCEDENGHISGGGGGHSFDELVNNPEYDNNICFYIPDTFTLKVWNVNDYDDIDDVLSIGGNDYDINTDSYELGYNYYITDNSYSGYAGYFKSLINACKIPLDFISSKITLFFDKLPPLIQYSIISGLFILIVIGLIKFLTGGK